MLRFFVSADPADRGGALLAPTASAAAEQYAERNLDDSNGPVTVYVIEPDALEYDVYEVFPYWHDRGGVKVDYVRTVSVGVP